MAWLHDNKEEFRNAVLYAADQNRLTPDAVEKDYYVTLILKGLKERLPFIVFKGGTSLSKCHKVINRFSEDIDVTIDTKLSQGQMGKVKDAVKAVAEELGITIPNIEETRSRRSYNKYLMAYETITEKLNVDLQPTVILETSFAEVSFPTVILPVHSYVGDIIQTEALEMVEAYGLLPFEMKVQGIDRTMVDKVFAICDYHMKGDVHRHSRHIYDIYKLLPFVPMNDNLRKLIKEVREVRAKNVSICHSAQPGVDVPGILKDIINDDVYRADYESVTSRILEEQILYETAIEAVRKIAESGLFKE
ncbi:MAG: nucleotidyl transferase AbiEii/AbiGii toxin family protein [Oscillospiraceae bacterium]|nr:nucleotidyl transferase AbiEii/AbiGii toxin family protein [Oscillospiraceae bacterium]